MNYHLFIILRNNTWLILYIENDLKSCFHFLNSFIILYLSTVANNTIAVK